MDPYLFGGLTVGLGLSWAALGRRVRTYRRIAARAIAEPALRRLALADLSEARVAAHARAGGGWRRAKAGLMGGAAGIYAAARARREDAELRVCLAEVLLAEGRVDDAQAELRDRSTFRLPRARAEVCARLAHQIEVEVSLAHGEPEEALVRLSGRDDGAALRLLRARALAALDRASDEVWRLLSEQPRAVLAEYAKRHPEEAAAVVAIRILDEAGAYR